MHRTFWHRCPCRARRLPAAAAKVQPIAAARRRRYSWKASARPGRPTVPIPLRLTTQRHPAAACGQVDLSYFSDAAFLGDSLTVGFSDYQINLSGALICGYTGVGPDAIVNRAAVKSPTRGQEIALDVLAAAQPKKLYILLGTNTLTTLGAADRFLAYYGQMLDELRQTLGEDCIIYVQSIPPVRPAAAEKKPGLASDVLRGVNEQLAQLAASKGCVYLDLWEHWLTARAT